MKRQQLYAATITFVLVAGRAGAWPIPSIPKEAIPADMPAAVRTQVEKLYSDNDRECTAAAFALRDMGTNAVSAAPFLAGVLQGHYSLRTANAATKALVKLGVGAFESAAAATTLSCGSGRRRAFHVVTEVAPKRAAPVVFAGFSGGPVHRYYFAYLRKCGETGRRLVLEALDSPDAFTRQRAARAMPAFSSMPASYRAFEGIENEIGIPNPGFDTQATVDRLIAAAADTNANVRVAALDSLAIFSACKDKKLPLAEPILKAVKAPEAPVQHAALEVVVRADAPAADRIAALVPAVSDPKPDVRARVATVLTRLPGGHSPVRTFPGEDARVRPLLVRLAGDESAKVRENAATGLGDVRAGDSVKTLAAMLDGASRRGAVAAATALGEIGGRAAVDALLPKAGAETEGLLRLSAVEALAAVYGRHWEKNRRARGGAPPDAALDDARVEAVFACFSEAVEDERHEMHRAALRALLRTPPTAGKDLAPPLILGLNSGDPRAREVVEGAILRDNRQDPRLFDAVVTAVSKGIMGPHGLGIQILGRTNDPRSIVALETRVRHGDVNTAPAAIAALGGLGTNGWAGILRSLARPDGRVFKERVSGALKTILKDPKALRFVQAARKGKDKRVRANAEAALALARGEPWPSAPDSRRADGSDVAKADNAPEETKGSEAGLQLVETDTELQARFVEVAGWVDDRKYAEAVEALHSIVISPDRGGFYPRAGNVTCYGTAAAEATRVLGTLPDDALDVYCRRHGMAAAERLETAAARDDEAALDAVGERYFHTPEGGAALARGAALALDKGRALKAAAVWESLYRQHRRLKADRVTLLGKACTAYHVAGVRDQAAALLARMAEKHPDATATVRGAPVGWRVFLEKMLAGAVAADEREPAPLASRVTAGGVVIVRHDDGVAATAADSGRELWRADGLPLCRTGTKQASGIHARYTGLAGNMGRRALSVADGRVFALAEFSPLGGDSSPGTDNEGRAEAGTSSLVALAVEGTGNRVLWRVGNGAGDSPFTRGAKFVAVPTSHGGRLYTLAVRGSRYHAVCLDAATGNLAWETVVGAVPMRAAAALSWLQACALEIATERGSAPAVADGVAVFLTNSGLIAALDANDGRPLWAYRYDSRVSGAAARPFAMTTQGLALLLATRRKPYEAARPVTMAMGRVVCLPCDSDHALSLDARTGALLRRRERGMSHP